MLIYTNGDSFVAGVELGDDILPDYPGKLSMAPESQQLPANMIKYAEAKHTRRQQVCQQWLANTYDQSQSLVKKD